LNYIYYDPKTKQVEAVFDTPFLSAQSGWEGKELIRAIVPPGIDLPSLDYKIDQVTTQDGLQVVERYSISAHPSSSAGSA
jgi:hypothetical protein